jgi:hypothetical protein
MAFVMPSSFEIACLISLWYFSFKRAAMSLFAFSTVSGFGLAALVPIRGVNH